MNWYKNHISGMKEDFMCWLVPLLYSLNIIPFGEYPNYNLSDYQLNWNRNRDGYTIEIDNFVVDRHTKEGRTKSVVEFALIGAQVENEAPFVNNIWKSFYNDSKRWEEGQPIKGPDSSYRDNTIDNTTEDVKETEEYKFIVRSQLNTSNSKMDVYFAKDHTGKLVVVKGPYSSRKEINILVSNTEWKKKYNLPYIPFIIRSLIPDRWPEGVPLGARNRINRNIPAFFIIFDSIIDEEQIQTITRSSKVWPETEVIDWSDIPLHFSYQLRPLTEEEKKDYVHAILYRYLFGISDFADRNFLMKNGRVISIDEDIENNNVNIYNELKKNKAEYFYNWIKQNYNKLNIQDWDVKDKNNISQINRLKIIKNYSTCLKLFLPNTGIPTNILDSKIESIIDNKLSQLKPIDTPVQQTDRLSVLYSKMNDNFVFIDNIYRSRMTLLDILEERGYNVTKYRKFSPAEATAAVAAFTSLSFKVSKKDDETKVCDVRYANISRQKLDTSFFSDIEDDNAENTEVIVMMSGPITDAHHIIALKQYMKMKESSEKERRKLRVSFFSIEMLVINPMRHILVPKHEIVPQEYHKDLMESMYITSKSKFPEIKFHVDPIARCIGAVPGDIVKITRPSQSSGESIIYRVCAP
jgi:DNA-directed RNA polymerase subunit H (RpoH/RPB5)